MNERTLTSLGSAQYWELPNIKTASFNEMRRAVLKLAEAGDVTAHYLMMDVLEEAFRRGAESSKAEQRNQF